MCEAETSTFRKSKNLFCKVIRRLVLKVVRFDVFLFFWAIYPDSPRKWVNAVPELSLYCVTFHCVLRYWCESPDSQNEKFCKSHRTTHFESVVRWFFSKFGILHFEPCRFNQIMFPHHPSPPSSSKVEMQHAARKEVGAALQKLGNQDLEAQKCWYNIDSQPTAHTFMFRALWDPPSSSACVKPFAQWCCDEAQKVCLPGHFARFLVCARKFMPTEAFLFTYVWVWHAPRTSCTTSEVRPYARTELRVSCTRPWSNMVSPMNQRRLHVTCILMSFRAHTRNWARSTGKHAFLGSSQRKWESCFRHPEGHYGLGPACNMNVWALGSDSML